MKYKVEKCFQIINDMMIYCYSLGGKDFQLDFQPSEDTCKIVLKTAIDHLSEDTLEELQTGLEQRRQQEVEGMYWAITYDVDSPCEPTLLGMMLDESTATYEDGILTIKAERNHG
ncbi:MAG TPA: hypothetical protein IAC41_09440 [Candidatus Merdenecus merdavium]|nr:hypothetical protein [Candidatus Merdenecus merdavium]